MADDLLGVLKRFHREVVMPDIERVVDERLGARTSPLRQELLSNFESIYKRFDRLESEYEELKAAVQRIEERLAVIEQKMDRQALRFELLELKERVADSSSGSQRSRRASGEVEGGGRGRPPQLQIIVPTGEWSGALQRAGGAAARLACRPRPGPSRRSG